MTERDDRTSGGGPILRPGDTCWRTAHADRVAFLIDGEAYFGSLADALERAQHRVWLIGWDFHTSVQLRRGEDARQPDELVSLLDSLARARPSLRVRILAWDYAMLYALEREFLPLLQFGARTHPHIAFAMDAAHPTGASHHQKIAIIDDAIAFVGGFDLTAHRWDTREHRPDDPHRQTPDGTRYQPFHDVQLAVDGEAAAMLAELARERWEAATGCEVSNSSVQADPWPTTLVPDARDVEVGIARTLPSYLGRPEVREIEALYCASIQAARRWIYLENQYLTATRVVEWLADRLREPSGPEIVVVGPRSNAGWLEAHTMGALRARALRTLRAADEHGRLRVLYPHVAGLDAGETINVHAKVMVVDDAFARVGSSNLANRSLGLDSECDLAFESRGREDLQRAIAAFRNDLLAEHLGTTPDRVEEELGRSGSLVQTVDRLCGGEARTLRPLEAEASEWAADAFEALGAPDPEHPIPLEELVKRFEHERPLGEPERPARWRLAGSAMLLAALVVAWELTPLQQWASAERLAAAFELLREPWYGPLALGAIFVLASLALVPVTALTVATGLCLGPWLGIPVAWLAGIAAAAVGHLAGRLLWRDTVRRLAGDRLNALSRRLSKSGVLSTAVVRVVPIAPFMVVNFVAGASHLRARDFIVGSAIGMLPGTVLLIWTADAIRSAISEPSAETWLWSAMAVLVLLGLGAAVRRVIDRMDPPSQ